MDEDLPVEGLKVRDETNYERDGTTSRWRVYAFYLGKHGPFTEKVPIVNFDPTAIQRAIDSFRLHLRSLPK